MSQPQLCIKHTQLINADDVPDTVDLELVKTKFSQHSYHLGAWLDSPLKTTDQKSPPVNKASHVVHDVLINEDGSLSVTLTVISSQRGYNLVKQFNNDFKLTPVCDPSCINIVRFDFTQEK